jgi:predicted dehydrogenase
MVLEEVNWGIIGCGNVTEVKNGPPLYKTPHSHLVAVMRRDGELASDYARRHGVPRWYSSATDLIHDPEVNAVYVATPPASHAEYAIQAMRAGKPVYVEKPMARNYSECLEMIRVSEETGVPLFVAYYRRALPLFLKVKELVEQGTIGKPLMVTVRLYQQSTKKEQNPENLPWRVKPEIAGAGIFYDLASHQLDFLDFLFGPVKQVQGQAVNLGKLYPAEDTVNAGFVFENQVVGSGNWCFVADKSWEEDSMTILGSAGSLKFACYNPVKLILQKTEGTIEFDFPKPQHVGGGLIQLVVDELRGIGQSPGTGKTAARTSWVMEEIVKGYYRGHMV